MKDRQKRKNMFELLYNKIHYKNKQNKQYAHTRVMTGFSEFTNGNLISESELWSWGPGKIRDGCVSVSIRKTKQNREKCCETKLHRCTNSQYMSKWGREEGPDGIQFSFRYKLLLVSLDSPLVSPYELGTSTFSSKPSSTGKRRKWSMHCAFDLVPTCSAMSFQLSLKLSSASRSRSVSWSVQLPPSWSPYSFVGSTLVKSILEWPITSLPS